MPGTELITLAAVMDVVRGAIMTLFILSAFLVVLIVLAQEGKGGGLAGAFGGAGTETFGVKAGTVNKATAWVGAMFLGLALIYAGMSSATSAPQQGVQEITVPGSTDGGTDGSTDGGSEDAGSKDGAPKDGGDEPKDGGDAPKDGGDAPKDGGDAPKDGDN